MPENEKNQGSCHTKERKGWEKGISKPFPKHMNRYSQGNRVCCNITKQSIYCNPARKKWAALLKYSGGWLLFEQQLFVRRQVTLWQKMRWALLASIPLALLTSSEVLKSARRAEMPPDLFEISQLVRVRSARSARLRLLEQNFLRSGCSTQIAGSCKVYAGKTDWKTSWKLYPFKQEVRSFDEAFWQMTPFRAAFFCSKACDIIAEDAFSVVSQHSSALFLRSAGSAWQELKGRYSWISELRGLSKESLFFFVWTLQADPASLSCVQGAVPVRSPRLLDRVLVLIHLLNEKSPHHARKRKEPGRMPYSEEKGHFSSLVFQGKMWIVTAKTIGCVAR